MGTVSRETLDRLAVLKQLVVKWSPTINLVSADDLNELWTRHINDCLQVAAHIDSNHIVDLGSGGGFPGLVIAAATEGRERNVILVEADQRKSAFLRTAVRLMELSSTAVIARRAEDLEPQGADLVTARALAPLPRLLTLVNRHLHPHGRALLMKGRQWSSEVDEARQMWDFKVDAIPSTSQNGAAILDVTNLQPR